MKIGPRIPSLRKRIAARTSLARVVRHSLGSMRRVAGAGSPTQSGRPILKPLLVNQNEIFGAGDPSHFA